MNLSPLPPTKVLRQTVGIDIASQSFEASLGWEQVQANPKFNPSKSFTNDLSGFEKFISWAKESQLDLTDSLFVIEATGVYYEALAFWLDEQDYRGAVLLPNTVVAFAKSLNKKSKNDQVDAQTLAHMGSERYLDLWKPAPKEYKELKQLTRHRQKLVHLRTMTKNQLHASKKEAPISDKVIDSHEEIITFFSKQIKQIQAPMDELIQSEPSLRKAYEHLLTIPTIGPAIGAVLLAETQGFQAFRNHKQLVSYAGYDVIQKQSGSSIHFQERMSKKGNVHIRRILFFPSINVSKYIPDFGRMYQKINEKNPQTKMKGSVALQRKLLVLAYHLVKREQSYDPAKHQ